MKVRVIGSSLSAGWYRLKGHGVSGPHELRIVGGAGEDVRLALPVALNGDIDHIIHLPFEADGADCIRSDGGAEGDSPSLSCHRLSSFRAWSLMLGRICHFFRHEGEMQDLKMIAEAYPAHECALREPASWLEELYGLIKQRMLHRKIPLSEYMLWRRLQRQHFIERDARARTSIRTRKGPVTVIIDGSHGSKGELEATLESIALQELPFEACLVVVRPASPPQDVPSIAGDTTITEMDADMSCALGSVLSNVETAYVWPVRAGDQFSRSACLVMSAAIADNPHCRCFYCDEDVLSRPGEYAAPVFKPDYDPVLQAAAGYIGRAGIHSTEHLESATSLADEKMVVHVPYVLFHGGTDSDQRQPGRAQRESRDNDDCCASLIIPTRDGLEVLSACVASIVKQTRLRSYEIIIVDNGSTRPETLEFLDELEASGTATVLKADFPFNYSRLNNLAAGKARADVLVFLNNDIEVVEPGWLDVLVSLAREESVGSVGARLLYPDGRIQHAGIVLGLMGIAGHAWKGVDPLGESADFRLSHPRTVSANTGACLAIRKKAFLDVGGFDESLAVAFNDVDLCLKLRREGLRNIWTPEATLIHHESVSRGRNTMPEKRKQLQQERDLMRRRWGALLAEDGYYNPNLTYDEEVEGLSLIPRWARSVKRS